MDLEALVTLFFEKMKGANYYSEITDESLHRVVYNYLESIYDVRVETIQLRADIELFTEKEYKQEMDQLKMELYVKASELFQVTLEPETCKIMLK